MTEPLADLQRWMHSALLQPDAAKPTETANRIVPNPRLSAAQTLAIYQRSYALRIASCMREQFPALCHALGTDLFNDFVAEYVSVAPPESYTLYDLGRRFSGFLEDSRPDRDLPTRESWIDFIVDLARFERAVFATFDCPGAEDLTLATHDTADAQLRAQPSLTVDQYRYPVAWYYHEVREKRAPNPPQAMPSCVAVVRKEYQTITVQVSHPHYLFLSAMCAGHSVDDALSHVAETLGTEKAQVTAAWKTAKDIRADWIETGFFLAV